MQPCSNLGAYRVQFLAGHDRAVEKQEYVIAEDVVSIKKGSTKCTPNNAPIHSTLRNLRSRKHLTMHANWLVTC